MNVTTWNIVVALTLVGSISTVVTGQSDWIRVADRQIESADPATDKWILANCHASRACALLDTARSLKYADAAIAAARELDERAPIPDLIATALAVKAIVVLDVEGPEAGNQLFDQAVATNPPTDQSHAWYRMIDYLFRTPEKRVDRLTRLQRLWESFQGENDAIVRARLCLMIAQQEMGLGELTAERIDECRQQIELVEVPSFAVLLTSIENFRGFLHGKKREAVLRDSREIIARARDLDYHHLDIMTTSLLSAISPDENLRTGRREELKRIHELATSIGSSKVTELALTACLQYAVKQEDREWTSQLVQEGTQLMPLLNGQKTHLQSAIVEAFAMTGDGAGAMRFFQNLLNDKDEQIATLENRITTTEAELENSDRTMALLAVVGMVGCLGCSVFLFLGRRRLISLNSKLTEEVASNARVLREQELLEERVSRLQRMESLGALAGGVAHDFNNLLVGILCNAQLLQRKNLNTHIQRECIQGIIDASEAASDLSQMMLAYTGRQPARTEAIDLRLLIDSMMPLLKAGFVLPYPIEVEQGETPIVAAVDCAQIEQIVLNLVSNASQSISKVDGKIEIRLGYVELDDVDEACFHGRRREGGSFTYIDVVDNGCGIAPADIERMFEPFYTGREDGKGLGLALVYGHVVRHDGLIQCTSKLGEGTKIRILLPAADDAPSDEFFESSGELLVSGHGHAMVIDDEPHVLNTMERLLQSNGWTCDIFEKPREALAALGQCDDGIDCVLVDVRMPEMDGHAVVEHLLSNHPHIPVTVVSGYSKKNLHQFREYPNVVGTLEKPFSTATVMGSLQESVKPR